jgi:hypothetical protein
LNSIRQIRRLTFSQRVTSLENLYEKIVFTQSTINQFDVPTFLKSHRSFVLEQADSTVKTK